MNRFRRALFWIFALAYVIVCPSVVLYALGYLKAGIVTLAVTPREAEVFIAGRIITGPWPQTLSQIAPGTYRSHISASGYVSQDREVVVARGRSTVLDRLLLLSDPVRPEPVVSAGEVSYSNLFPLEGTSNLLLERPVGESSTLVAYDWKKEKRRAVLSVESPLIGAPTSRVDSAQGSPVALVWFRQGEGFTGVSIDLSQDPPAVRSDSVLVTDHPLPVFWDPSRPENFFVARGEQIHRIFEEKADQPSFSPELWRGFGVGDGKLYGLDPDGHLRGLKMDGSLRNPEAPAPSPEEVESSRLLFGDGIFYRIIPRKGEAFFFLGENGRLLQNQLPHELADGGIAGIRISLSSDRTLAWKADRVGVIDVPAISEVTSEEGQFQSGRAIRWFYERGVAIRSAHFIYGGSHALVLDGNRVLLFELFSGATGEGREVVETYPDSGIAWVEETGTLYYLDARQGRLQSARLLPEAKSPIRDNTPPDPSLP